MQYADRATAPLKFHKFLTWFALPVGTLLSFSNLVLWISMGMAGDYYFDTLYYFLDFLFVLLCLVNMWRWSPDGPKLLFLRQGLGIINSLSLVLSDIYLNRSTSDSAGRLFGIVVATIIFWVYYQKRMPLFTGKAPSVHFARPEEPKDSKSSDPHQADLMDVYSQLPPILIAEPEKIPLKYKNPFQLVTGDTRKDLLEMRKQLNTVGTRIEWTMTEMDRLGLPPGDPKREQLAHQFLGLSISKQLLAYTIGAIQPDNLPPPKQLTSDSQIKNAQFQVNLIYDLIMQLHLGLSASQDAKLKNDSDRLQQIETEEADLERQISDAQTQLFRIYRM